jgi:hypothetical protein
MSPISDPPIDSPAGGRHNGGRGHVAHLRSAHKLSRRGAPQAHKNRHNGLNQARTSFFFRSHAMAKPSSKIINASTAQHNSRWKSACPWL